MESYNLGPNGSLVMVSDMVATRLGEIQKEVDSLNPDYVIDSPGQIELFAFRPSGQYFKSNFHSDNSLTLFIFDGILIALLASSIKLRLKTAQVNVISKRDLIAEKLKDLGMAASNLALKCALNNEKDSESSLLSKDLARGRSKGGFMQNLIDVSSVTMKRMASIWSFS